METYLYSTSKNVSNIVRQKRKIPPAWMALLRKCAFGAIINQRLFVEMMLLVLCIILSGISNDEIFKWNT